MKPSKLAAALVLIATLTSCTSFRSYQRARDLEIQQDWDGAVQEYSKALAVDPQNMQYRIGLQRAKLEASRMHFEKGKTLRAAGQNELAAMEFQLTVKLDPTNQFAAVELSKALNDLEAAQRALDSNSIDEVKKRAVTKAQPPTLNPASDEPISLSFPRETPVKDIYRALGNAFGMNILFDGGVKDDRITIELRDVTAQQALERLMQAANHFYKVLDEKTIIVIPDNPQARRDYEDLVIRTFYLSNGDAEQVTNVVRTMIEARNVFPLKALNAITIRDTADKVRIAEKIIQANDKARAEVVVDVELLQLDIGKLRDMGIDINGLSGTATVLKPDGTPRDTRFRLSDFRTLSSNVLGFTIPSASYTFVKNNTDGKLLAKPQLRISEGEKAMLTIGKRIPVPVSTFSSINPGGNTTYQPVTSYQYQDVGIKITMEPRVHHNREVTLKMTVEVSNLSGYAPAPEGQPAQPEISTRTIDSTIRLKDGETNFLAGLIRKDETNTDTGVPFLADLPLIGRLFKHTKETHGTTDLVLTTTPHIIRIPDITEDDLAPMWVGTTNNLTFRGVSPRLESPTAADPFMTNRGDEAFQQAAPTRAGDFPRTQEAEPNPVYLPPGAAPTDPFTQPVPAPLPPIENAPEVEEESVSPNARLQKQSAAAPASNAPRIAPQPSTLVLKSGEARRWVIVGMDLEDTRTPSLQLRFDTTMLLVEQVTFGTALRIDAAAPPAVNIDAQNGVVTISSTNGQPLQFDIGGEILSLHVRGANVGDSFLVLDGFNLRNAQGEPVAAYISGGKSRVQ